MNGELGFSLPEDLKMSPQLCNENSDCLDFGANLRLTVRKDDPCYYMNWTSTQNITIEDCFDYAQDQWYGGPENIQQYWPFNNMTYEDFSYILKMQANQAIAEPYWVTSAGYYIYVSKTVPLFINSNNDMSNGFCLKAQQVPPYLPRSGTTLTYKICTYKDIRKAHTLAVKNDLGKPKGTPDQRMVQHPIWSTWVRFKVNVNASAVLTFAKDVVKYEFNNSQIEIDDNWETCYGSAEFNKSRFPNMPKLGSDLDKMGFRVTLWNHPFINTNCKLFNVAKDKGYLVKDQDGNVVSTWWDGQAGAVDFTNQEAADWYVKRHKKLLKDNHINAVKQDAGESSWLPQIPQLNADPDDQPNAYSAAYVRTVAKFGNLVEARVGHGTQDLDIFVRMDDKDSKWTFDNGLPTVLTTTFQMNLNGYTFVLPDMVGGNAYGSDVVTKELFIRWLQLTTFLPSIQFSAAPWDFDNETIAISKKFTALHYEYSDKIIEQMQECVKSGAPVNMPIWWVAPRDKVAHSIWSEYMLGDDILVAPVVEKGAVSRDIYLPKGHWRDEVDPSHQVYHGKQWLRDYPAPLDTLPYFTRVSNIDEDLC